jgi:hypothetical protein
MNWTTKVLIEGSHIHLATKRIVTYRMQHHLRPSLLTWTAEIERGHPQAALLLSGAVPTHSMTQSADDAAKASLHAAIDRLDAHAL